LKATSGPEFTKILEKNGWELKRVKGSHHVYMKAGNPARISVPVHGKKPLKVGLLKHVMKIAGLKGSDL
jgi:predicted RNA binding protein YcfA (HicA-like mRNA interferase family)